MTVELDLAPVGVGEHLVTFYETGDRLARTVAGFLAAGDPALVVATPDHRRDIAAALAAAGADVPAARAAGRYTELDAAELLAELLVADDLEPNRFETVVGGLVRGLNRAGRPVRVFGEMVSLLWEAGAVPAALDLEGLWCALTERVAMSLLCGYRFDAPLAAENRALICRRHTGVLAATDPAPATPPESVRAFEPTPLAARLARRFVVDTLERWRCPAELLETAQLVAGELASNAVRHARQRFRVGVRRVRGGVYLEVSDGGPRLPTPVRLAGDGALSGRGLELVAALCRAWGVHVRDGEKTVWAEIVSGSIR